MTKQFGQIISENPIATRAYSQMQKFGTDVKLDFGTPPDRLTYGEFFRYKNQMKIYMPNNVDARTAVSTMTHETSHGRSLQLGRQFGSQMDEFRAFTREFIFKEGRRPTLQERQDLWNDIQLIYKDKPLERNPFGGRKQ